MRARSHHGHGITASKAERVDWLLAHQDIWCGYPGADGRMDDRLLEALKAAHLYAPKTRGVRMDTLIGRARQLRRARWYFENTGRKLITNGH
jgi:hypothetical protein